MHLALPMILALAAVGAIAGCLGAMVGVGGGVLLVPALAIGFGIDLKIAIATSLVAVLATSTAAGSVYVGRGLANMRIAMTLETTTTMGGILGGIVAVYVSPSMLSWLFAIMMLVTAVLMLRGKRDAKKKEATVADPKPTADAGQDARGSLGYEDPHALAGGYYDEHARSMVHYQAARVPLGMVIALVAGMVSGMLGVGGGFLKVPAMNIAMRVPLRVAAATSNVMIGVTAIASLFVYYARGFVHPPLAAAVALGVVGGSLVGTVLASKASPRALRFVLAAVLIVVSIEMVLRARGIRVA